MRAPLILVAAGGLAREVVACLEDRQDWEVVGVLDDALAPGNVVAGVPVLGPVVAAADEPRAHFVVCAGKGATRSAIVDRLSVVGIGTERFATVVDSSVRVTSSCSVGAGSVVLAGTVLTADVTLGRHVVVMPKVTLTHDDHVEDFATLCAATTLGGSVRIGSAAYLGMASSVREGLTVGRRATLGMGSVLTHDLPSGETWVGNPARPLGRGQAEDRPRAAEGGGRRVRPVTRSDGPTGWSTW